MAIDPEFQTELLKEIEKALAGSGILPTHVLSFITPIIDEYAGDEAIADIVRASKEHDRGSPGLTYFENKREQSDIKQAILDAIPRDVFYHNLNAVLAELLRDFIGYSTRDELFTRGRAEYLADQNAEQMEWDQDLPATAPDTDRALHWITQKTLQGRGAVVFSLEENNGWIGVWIGPGDDEHEPGLGYGSSAEEAVLDAIVKGKKNG